MRSLTIKKRILAATGGLIEAIPGTLEGLHRTLKEAKPQACSVLRVIHRTVQTCLDEKGGREELTFSRFYPALPDELWMRTCVAIIGANVNLVATLNRNCRADENT